jgi:hypothetical protein
VLFYTFLVVNFFNNNYKVHFPLKFSCPWIRMRDADSQYRSGSTKSLNPDQIRSGSTTLQKLLSSDGTKNVYYILTRYFKGIVSRDLHICFWYHLLKPLLLKFRFRVEFFLFLLLSLVSLPCSSQGLKGKIFSIGYSQSWAQER